MKKFCKAIFKPSQIPYIVESLTVVLLVIVTHAKTKASNFKSMALIIRELGISITDFFDSPIFNFDNLDIETGLTQ